MAKRGLVTRRQFVKAAGLGIAAAGVAPTIFIPRQARGASKELKILVCPTSSPGSTRSSTTSTPGNGAK